MIITKILLIIPIATYNLSSVTIIFFLIDGYYFNLKATINSLVTTYVPISRIVNIAFFLIYIYTLIKIYCKGFSYFSMKLTYSLGLFNATFKTTLYFRYFNNYP